jgi:glycolate oxidase iron-sulfur subunit
MARRKPASRTAKKAMLFIGCGTNFMFSDAGESTVTILENLGYETVVVDHGCCGLPAYAYGETRAAEHLALSNIRSFVDDSDCLIVTDCSSCASFLKDYPTLLSRESGTGVGSISQAQQFSSRVKDITEILAGEEALQLLLRGKDDKRVKHRGKISFHYPCHLSRYQHLSDSARRILGALPGFDFVEMQQAEWCCGGAGTFAVEHPDLSRQILKDKIRNISSSGAGVIVTTCPSCLIQLQDGARDVCPHVRVAHLVEIIRECLH